MAGVSKDWVLLCCPRHSRIVGLKCGFLRCSRYSLLRADVGRLPFKTGTLAGIHAGAALHCWPNPLAAVSHCR